MKNITPIVSIIKNENASHDPSVPIRISGWVRHVRGSAQVKFVSVNDGSTFHNLQIVLEREELLALPIHTGVSLVATGHLRPSPGKGQTLELSAEEIQILGDAPPEEYPIQPKKHSMEFLRENAHLRLRTQTFSSVFRVRHYLNFSIHRFFHERGFYHIPTPIITASDAEGAGEVFTVTTLKEFNTKNVDSFSADFFGRKTNLTVSGQLEAETAALSLSKVYTFGPTFRAENSNTSRHLSEFWMVEPEMAFYELPEDMELAEEFLKFLLGSLIHDLPDDMEFLSDRREKEQAEKPRESRDSMSLLEKLNFILTSPFQKITYTDALQILASSSMAKKKKFQYPVEPWGVELQSEHERYLVEKEFNRPVILTDFPEKSKAFYMKRGENGTVRAMDVLFPQIGEIIGGSQREDNIDILKEKMESFGISAKELWWYLDTRRFGGVPHAGFGLGFERLVQFATGMNNIRDVILFPRAPGILRF